MTLVALWVRRNATLSELVAVSDSRLSGGESWDRCPKLVPLPRPATAIAMSGDATTAYAFLLQAMNACLLLDGNEAGRTDIRYLARKLRDAYADSRRDVSDLPTGQDQPDVPVLDVVLFGWSWRRLQFEAYSYSYDSTGVLRMHTIRDLEESVPYGVYFAGDARDSAKIRLQKLLEERGSSRPLRGQPDSAEQAKKANLNWEPLEVVQDVIEDASERTVGGVPQLLKIYQYGMSETFVWRTKSGDYFGGREVKHGERFDRRVASFADGDVVLQYSDRAMRNVTDKLEESDDEQ
ncbi:hypothetical protein [Frigoribacterium sp. Leaf263]|uniref:hypothetical protein n=1 Tax=Frigoribacterium sp. Leaf263 TaxID=1736313 RepID=UPI0012E1BA55|nr:hypothetical protein [Frigoribacterium sp. Leaf263]